MRIFAIGDIHGCNQTFIRLLAQLQPDRDEPVYLLGDYIDRGPDSHGVIETILGLQRDGYDIRPILGNHEALLLHAIDNPDYPALFLWLENGGDETLASYGADAVAAIPDDHISFLRELPVYRQSDQHLFVHGGLDFSRNDPLTTDRHDMLWRRDTRVDPGKIGGRVLVCGHSIKTQAEIRASVGSPQIWLDNGCVYPSAPGEGALAAIELVSGRLYFQDNIDCYGWRLF
jgi:serine/threonine protein phosphatase 1